LPLSPRSRPDAHTPSVEEGDRADDPLIGLLAPDPRRAPSPARPFTLRDLLDERLGPALYARLTETGRLDRFTPSEQDSLREAHAANARRNFVLAAELHRVVEALGGAGMPVMPLKGAVALLEPIYPSPSIRVMTDLDLLVPPERREAAIACLSRLGYRPRTAELVLPDVEHPMDRDGIVVDLHWRLSRIPEHGDAAGIWARARPAGSIGATLYLPEAIDQMYLRFLHDTLQDHQLHRLKLWKAYEAALLYRRVERRGEERRLVERAAGAGLDLVLGAYLAQIDRLFPCLSSTDVALRSAVEAGGREIDRLERGGAWPERLHFAVGRDLLLRLRRRALGGYGPAFVQIMWRESTLAEPTDVVRPTPLSRLRHVLQLCALHLLAVAGRLVRGLLVPGEDRP
jgi:hypothetical protein